MGIPPFLANHLSEIVKFAATSVAGKGVLLFLEMCRRFAILSNCHLVKGH